MNISFSALKKSFLNVFGLIKLARIEHVFYDQEKGRYTLLYKNKSFVLTKGMYEKIKSLILRKTNNFSEDYFFRFEDDYVISKKPIMFEYIGNRVISIISDFTSIEIYAKEPVKGNLYKFYTSIGDIYQKGDFVGNADGGDFVFEESRAVFPYYFGYLHSKYIEFPKPIPALIHKGAIIEVTLNFEEQYKASAHKNIIFVETDF